MTGGLPSGWALTRIEDVAHLVRGVTFKKPEASPEAGPRLVPIVRAGNIDGARAHLDRDLVYVPRERVGEEQYLRSGDILLATSSGSLSVVGKSALIAQDWHGAHGAFMAVLRPCSDVEPAFLGYFVQSEYVRRKWRHAAAGTNINNLKKPDILSTEVPLCPSGEQQRIVATIEEHFSRLDAADDSMAAPSLRTAQLLESVLQAELGTAKLHDQPLSDFLTEPLANGRSVPTAEDYGFPVLRLTCLRDGWVDTSESKQGNFGEIDHRRYQVESGDFLISRGNGSLHLVGIGGLVPHGAHSVAYPDTLIRARVDRSRLRPEYLSLIWNSRVIRRQLESQARTTAGIYKVNQSMIGDVLLPVPSPDVQDRIIRRLELVRQTVLQLDAEVDRYHLRSASLRQSILSTAFSGRLVPQNPDDEPASVLLERIAASQTTKPRRRGPRHDQ